MQSPPHPKAKTHHQCSTPHNQKKPSLAQNFLEKAFTYDDRLWIWTVSSELSTLDNINPALTRYGRTEPAPVLPLREEPDLLSWLETSGRLVEDEESSSPEVSTVEEEELSALMGEKEEYNAADEQSEENWED